MADAFDVFYSTKPEHPDPTAQMLYEYNQHYMQLVQKFQSQIEFIDRLHQNYRQEHVKFYSEDLPTVSEKLQTLPISEDVRQEWIESLQTHMKRSFETSKNFIDILTTKKIEEFNEQLEAKLKQKFTGASDHET